MEMMAGGPPEGWRLLPLDTDGARETLLMRAPSLGIAEDALLDAACSAIVLALRGSDGWLTGVADGYDHLTGLPDRRHALSWLDQEEQRVRRYDGGLATLLIGLDRLRGVNDFHGHAVGDLVLRTVGEALSRMVRTTDLAAHFGGDQFLLALPRASGVDAMIMAERVRQTIANTPIAWKGAQVRITASVGVANLPDDATTRDWLLLRARHALALAKRLGGNQVQSASDSETLALKETAHGQATDPAYAPALHRLLFSLARAVERRDGYRTEHLAQVSSMCVTVARALGLSDSDVDLVHRAALLHAVSKVAVADGVLTKGQALAEGEWEQLHSCAEASAEVLAGNPTLEDVAPLIVHHREHWDGSGYPVGLEGEAIPMGARILGAVSAYQALVWDRPYRPASTVEAALAVMRQGAGVRWDTAVVREIVRLVEGNAVRAPSPRATMPINDRSA